MEESVNSLHPPRRRVGLLQFVGGATYVRTFDVPGQYTYFCIPHEALGVVGHHTVSG
jgi:plastocyanin